MQAYRNGELVDLTAEDVAALEAERAMTPAKLRAYTAAKRYAVEVGGTKWNGYSVQTDRDSQSKLISEFVAMQAGLRSDPSIWKFGNGFASVSNADMAQVIIQARTHVLTAFGIEGQLQAGIAAGTITTTEQIDAAAWPSNT